MELITAFYKPDTIDCYTFVFDVLNPGGYHTMLATDETGRGVSQWTEGRYEPNIENAHLGNQLCLIGGVLLSHVLHTMEA